MASLIGSILTECLVIAALYKSEACIVTCSFVLLIMCHVDSYYVPRARSRNQPYKKCLWLNDKNWSLVDNREKYPI